MAKFRVRALRLAGGEGLEHITDLCVEARKDRKLKVRTKARVIKDIRAGRNKYDTKVDGAKADVKVVDCPGCASGDYLRRVDRPPQDRPGAIVAKCQAGRPPQPWARTSQSARGSSRRTARASRDVSQPMMASGAASFIN